MKKIIIVGDTQGHFDHIFNKINTIHTKHGPFTAAFCVGNFFGNDPSQLTPYIEEKKSIAIPTYFIVSNDENTSIIDKLPNKNDGGEICKNLSFLGRFGLKNINGISVAYLSGLYDPNLFSKTPSEIRTTLAIKELKDKQDKKENDNDEHKEKEQEQEEKLEDTKAATEFRRYYCSQDVKQMNSSNNVDILLTSEWGRLFHLGIVHKIDQSSIIPNNLSLSQFSKFGRSPIVNKLALQFNPQYHFTGNEDIFFRLCPYKTNDTSKCLTRFISLGKVQSSSQQKSIYACNITPITNQSSTQTIPSNIKYTKCPYTLPFKPVPDENEGKNNHNDNTKKDELKRVVHKRTFSEMMNEAGNNGNSNNSMHHRWSHPHRKNSDNPPSNYVCYKCGIPGHYINECQQFKNNKTGNNYGHRNQPGGNRDDYFFEKFGGRRAMKRARKSGGECWFCLGSTKVESHMVLSIAEYTYIALAKGPMIKDHLLIIPINHLSNSMKFPVGVRKEIDRYLICLEKCYEKENKVLLICDRNLPTQYTQHCYLEVVAIDKDKVNGLKESLFKEAEKEDIKFDVKTKSDNNYNVGSFGYLILHNNGNGEKYIHSLQSGIQKRIPLNFLRRVIAIHLEIPEKSEWTACIQQTAEETNQTNRLKDKFKPYDWTQSQLINK